MGETSHFRKINLSPSTIVNYSFYPNKNYLIVFLENEMRIYDFYSMNLISKFQVLQYPSVFTNLEYNILYVLEFDQTSNINNIKIFDLDKKEMTH